MNNVFDLNKHKLIKQAKEDLDNGDNKLYVMNGVVTSGSRMVNRHSDNDDKLTRIKKSLDRINELMVELKKLNKS